MELTPEGPRLPATDPEERLSPTLFASAFDEELEPLAEVAVRAISGKRLVIALHLWRTSLSAPLLPFYLGIRNVHRFDSVPLNSCFGYYPFVTTDSLWHELPLCEVGQAFQNRQVARVHRLQVTGSAMAARADWEQVVSQLRRDRTTAQLPGCSYVSLQRIQSDGTVRFQPRPVIGRRAKRGDFKPGLRLLAPSNVAPPALASLISTDLLIVNAQHQRGAKSIERLKEVVRAASNSSCLLLASAPSELYRLRQAVSDVAECVLVGDEPHLDRAYLVSILDERAVAEKEFRFATEGLDLESPLAIAAKTAWWAIRQAFGDDFQSELAWFDEMYSRLASESPADALRFLGVRSLLHRSAELCLRDRLTQAVRTVFDACGRAGTLVVTRNNHSARNLRGSLAEDLGVTPVELAELGIVVMGKTENVEGAIDVAVLTGFFGIDTFDLVLAARPKTVVLVMDEIETRAALWAATTLQRTCQSFGITVSSLEQIRAALLPHVRAQGEDVELELNAQPDARARYPTVGSQVSAGLVTLLFTDGSFKRVPRNRRFDLFLGRLKMVTVRAEELRPGDAVVILETDSHAALSDQLLTKLDAGGLREHALARSTWIYLVRAAYQRCGKSVAAVGRHMAAAGHGVDTATIRTWISRSDSDESSVPMSLDRFIAFSQGIEVELPESLLENYFQSIALLRRKHRHAGRVLARAVRGIHLNRLDVVTLRKLEAEWGFDPKELLAGARVLVVDEMMEG